MHHLAQVNIAKMAAPLTDGRLRLHEAWWWLGSAPRPRQYSALVDAVA